MAHFPSFITNMICEDTSLTLRVNGLTIHLSTIGLRAIWGQVENFTLVKE